MIPWKLVAILFLALGLIGIGFGWRSVQVAGVLAELRQANAGFEKQQKAMEQKGIEDAAALAQSVKDMQAIAANQQAVRVRIEQIPLESTDCPTKLRALQAEAARFRARATAPGVKSAP